MQPPQGHLGPEHERGRGRERVGREGQNDQNSREGVKVAPRGSHWAEDGGEQVEVHAAALGLGERALRKDGRLVGGSRGAAKGCERLDPAVVDESEAGASGTGEKPGDPNLLVTLGDLRLEDRVPGQADRRGEPADPEDEEGEAGSD